MDELLALQKDYAKTLPERAAGVGQEVQSLVKSLGSGAKADYSKIEKLVHKVAGSGGTFGFHALSTIAAFLEDAIVEGRMSKLNSKDAATYLLAWHSIFTTEAALISKDFSKGQRKIAPDVAAQLSNLENGRKVA